MKSDKEQKKQPFVPEEHRYQHTALSSEVHTSEKREPFVSEVHTCMKHRRSDLLRGPFVSEVHARSKCGLALLLKEHALELQSCHAHSNMRMSEMYMCLRVYV